jgi:hypothetical protein
VRAGVHARVPPRGVARAAPDACPGGHAVPLVVSDAPPPASPAAPRSSRYQDPDDGVSRPGAPARSGAMGPGISAARAHLWSERHAARRTPAVAVAELLGAAPDGVLLTRLAVASRGLTAAHGQGLRVVHSHLLLCVPLPADVRVVHTQRGRFCTRQRPQNARTLPVVQAVNTTQCVPMCPRFVANS